MGGQKFRDMSTNESSTEKTVAPADNKAATTTAPDAKTEKVETKKSEAEKPKTETKSKTADPKPETKGEKSERRDDDDDRRPRRTSRDERDTKDDEPRGRRDSRRDEPRDDDRRPRRDEPRDDRRDDRSRDDRPRDDRPREERPREERSRDDRPKDDRPREERSKDDRPKEDKPKEDRPRDRGDRDDRRERSSRDEESKDDRDDDGDEDGGSDEGEDSGEQGAWYSTGYKEQESIDDREAAGGDTKTRRHWMRAGEEIEGVILDGGKADKEKWKRKACAPFCVWEHNFATEDADGELTFHDETCIAGRVGADGKAVKCWFCVNRPKIKRRYVGHYTVATSWEGKKGVVRWGKKLLPANKRLMKKFRRQEARSGLLGTIWDICRTDEGSARIGDDWQMKDDRPYTDAELQDLLGENADISPIDYVEECRPKSWNQLEDEYGKAKFSDPGKRKRGGRDRRRRDDDRGSGRDDRGRDDRSRDDRGRDDDRRTERSRDDRDRDDRDRDRPRDRDDRRDEPRDDRSRDERPRGGNNDDIPF